VSEMKCLYCREVGQPSRTIEHFIPERLGEGHPFTLPVGVVCDRCQNWASHHVAPAIWNSDIVLRHWLFWFHVPGKHGKAGVMRGKSGDVFAPSTVKITMSDDERTTNQMDRDELFLSRSIYKMALGALSWNTSLERALAPEYDSIGRALRTGRFLPYRRAIGRWIDQGVGIATHVAMEGAVVGIQLYAVTYWACLRPESASSAFDALEPVPGARTVLKIDHGPLPRGRHTTAKQIGGPNRIAVEWIEFDSDGWITPDSIFNPPAAVQILPQDSPGWREPTSG
jgi:hypothetical protein